jgi:outer membrane protein assembly factor BamB
MFIGAATARGADHWIQLKYDCGRSGNAPELAVKPPLSLVAAVPLTDAVFTAPVVGDGRVYVLDGAGVAFCMDAKTLKVLWKFKTPGGPTNCNNVSSPALASGRLHFGTMAGRYFVLDAASGAMIKEIACGEPIFSAPVVVKDRVYFATLGSQIYALTPDGEICWTWDYVRERLGFTGDRWSGTAWRDHVGRVGHREQFLCSRDMAAYGKTLVIPAGGEVVWLEDGGQQAKYRGADKIPTILGAADRENPGTFGLSVDADGTVYRQWHRRDNSGAVEILRLAGDKVGRLGRVVGTEAGYDKPRLLAYASVSLRDGDVYRCAPEIGFGLCKHTVDGQVPYGGTYPSIAPPILLKDHAVYGGLDGRLYVVPLAGGEPWSFKTTFGKAITAPVAVYDGHVYFGCEDGYLYALGPEPRGQQGGAGTLPAGQAEGLRQVRDLGLHKICSPLTGPYTGSEHDWFTNFGNLANTNVTRQPIEPPFRIAWLRRYDGTVKHMSVCGGGRMYTHTAEGQIFAVEQETGRLLWRRYFPGVHVSFTCPLYHEGRLYVPQAGTKISRLRCLDAATGKLIWEAPFTGSPSWNRQLPPIPYQDLIIYCFGTGTYTPKTWLFEHQSTFGFSADEKPLLRAYHIETGKEVWTVDFSRYGQGGDDAGMCLLDGTIYYSCYFGGRGPLGVTAAVDPETGRVKWATTKYAVHAGCTVSGADGRIYLGGYNPVEGKVNRVWCLDANDGSLVWKSDPVRRAIHVVSIAEDFLFTHAQYEHGYLIDKRTGKIRSTLTKGYHCTRFTLCEPYLLGPDLTIFDLSQENRLIHSGPAVDVLMCVGAFASNGRIYYTTNSGGMQVSLVGASTSGAR